MVRQRTVLASAAVAMFVVLASVGMTLGHDRGAVASAATVAPLAATAGCGKAATLSSGTHSIAVRSSWSMAAGHSSCASWMYSGGTAVRPVIRSRSSALSTSRGIR